MYSYLEFPNILLCDNINKKLHAVKQQCEPLEYCHSQLDVQEKPLWRERVLTQRECKPYETSKTVDSSSCHNLPSSSQSSQLQHLKVTWSRWMPNMTGCPKEVEHTQRMHIKPPLSLMSRFLPVEPHQMKHADLFSERILLQPCWQCL